MSQWNVDIFSTDLCILLSNFVATDVYALFKKSFKIICNIHVQNEGGGGWKAVWTMLKNLHYWWGRASLTFLSYLKDMQKGVQGYSDLQCTKNFWKSCRLSLVVVWRNKNAALLFLTYSHNLLKVNTLTNDIVQREYS